MLQRADHSVQERLAADKAMIRQQVGTISEMLAGPEADFEMQRPIIAEQSPGRDRPFLRHFDLRAQLLKQLRLSRAELVPLTARSEKRREGKECVCTCRARGAP